MKERPLDPHALDVLALCKAGGTLQGQQALASLLRLAASFCAATDGSASWRAQGRLVPVAGGEAEVWLDLQAQADVPLECQRCLQAMTETVQLQRRFRFVRSEEEAARLDEEVEDDVLVLPARLDLHELVEDELILALPIVPRHLACPQPLPMPAPLGGEGSNPPHPFAALAALRGRGDGGPVD